MNPRETPVNGSAEMMIRRLLRLRRGPWEGVATVVIAAGVAMLMQPFFLGLFTYSFATILFGTVMFVVVSHFRD
jgi:hypothetical protein